MYYLNDFFEILPSGWLVMNTSNCCSICSLVMAVFLMMKSMSSSSSWTLDVSVHLLIHVLGRIFNALECFRSTEIISVKRIKEDFWNTNLVLLHEAWSWSWDIFHSSLNWSICVLHCQWNLICLLSTICYPTLTVAKFWKVGISEWHNLDYEEKFRITDKIYETKTRHLCQLLVTSLVLI